MALGLTTINAATDTRRRELNQVWYGVGNKRLCRSVGSHCSQDLTRYWFGGAWVVRLPIEVAQESQETPFVIPVIRHCSIAMEL